MSLRRRVRRLSLNFKYRGFHDGAPLSSIFEKEYQLSIRISVYDDMRKGESYGLAIERTD